VRNASGEDRAEPQWDVQFERLDGVVPPVISL
jgi:hypothetical protein